ncbi:hypothetical protein [Agaribacter flavus]|uniref:Uncharacterized protein n=1 Tax=Agaribacter flavus TaxID=1902781 RepID=A0ABV7FST2_9ALTE
MAKNKQIDNQTDFFDKPQNIKIMMLAFYALCVLLVVLDFIVHRHVYVDFEKVPTFYALYGFIACVVLVVLAKIMRKAVMRDENYYDDRSENNTVQESTQNDNSGENV